MKLASAAAAILAILAVAIFLWDSLHVREGISSSDRQIRALASAIEEYHSDHGHYPSDPASTELLASNHSFDSDDYGKSSAFLYKALTGSERNSSPEAKNYVAEINLHHWTRKNQAGETYFVDSWGHSLGYSTLKAVHPESSEGNNPTFDLWSTGGDQRQPDILRWVKNW